MANYPARMEVYQAADGWCWRLRAQNGNIAKFDIRLREQP